jgi:hypothetical protein
MFYSQNKLILNIKYYYNIWNAYNIYMNCHTYQHFHMFLFHTINGRIFSTLINTRVTSLIYIQNDIKIYLLKIIIKEIILNVLVKIS